jgi:hypothetical protein
MASHLFAELCLKRLRFWRAESQHAARILKFALNNSLSFEGSPFQHRVSAGGRDNA